jgi:hypothetical protein
VQERGDRGPAEHQGGAHVIRKRGLLRVAVADHVAGPSDLRARGVVTDVRELSFDPARFQTKPPACYQAS